MAIVSTKPPNAAAPAEEKRRRRRRRKITPARERLRVRVDQLRAWRYKRLMSQEQLAAVSTVDRSTIIAIEAHGRAVNPATVVRLAEALRVSAETLVYEDPACYDDRRLAGAAG